MSLSRIDYREKQFPLIIAVTSTIQKSSGDVISLIFETIWRPIVPIYCTAKTTSSLLPKLATLRILVIA